MEFLCNDVLQPRRSEMLSRDLDSSFHNKRQRIVGSAFLLITTRLLGQFHSFSSVNISSWMRWNPLFGSSALLVKEIEIGRRE